LTKKITTRLSPKAYVALLELPVDKKE